MQKMRLLGLTFLIISLNIGCKSDEKLVFDEIKKFNSLFLERCPSFVENSENWNKISNQLKIKDALSFAEKISGNRKIDSVRIDFIFHTDWELNLGKSISIIISTSSNTRYFYSNENGPFKDATENLEVYKEGFDKIENQCSDDLYIVRVFGSGSPINIRNVEIYQTSNEILN